MNYIDDTINIPQKRVFEICDEIIRRGLNQKIEFSCLIRGNRSLVSLELFQKLKEANFTYVCLGAESASPKVLKAMRKHLTPKEASQCIRLARAAGIQSVRATFMVGNWDETVWDVMKTWRFVLTHNVEPTFWICTPYPGTDFYWQLREAGYLEGEPNWSEFDRVTCVSRTNRMSKPTILTVYILSVALQIVLNLFRRRNWKSTYFLVLSAILHMRDKAMRAIKRAN